MAGDTATKASTKSGGAGTEGGRATAEGDAPAEVQYVVYTGDAGVREITKSQWAGAGVEDQDTIVWDEANEYKVPVSKFSAAALEVIKPDKQLVVR